MVSRRSADVLVVGAGSAGAAAARFFAEQGRSVVLADKRERGATGARWLNLVPRWCFERAGVKAPSGAEAPLGVEAHAAHLVSPGGTTQVSLPPLPNIHVDMGHFVDRLVGEAIDASVELVCGQVQDVEIERERVRGLVFSSGADRFAVRASLIVDASGLGGAVRRRVLRHRCPDPEPLDICAAAEYQHDVRDRAGFASFLARYGAQPGDSIAFPGVAGGYSTLTIFTEPELREVGVLAGSIPALGVPNGAALHARFVASASWLGPARKGGAGAIPVRRPYAVLGGAGVALVGDAACQVYGSHGSGVGMGLIAARVLADACARWRDPGSDEAIAAYGRAFHREHGGLLAASDAFRRFAQGSHAVDIRSIFDAGFLEPDLAASAVTQQPTTPDAGFFFRSAKRAISAPRTTVAFVPVALRTAALERLGAFGGVAAIDRVIEVLVGRSPAPSGPLETLLPLGAT